MSTIEWAPVGDYPCPMYEIINFSIVMLHFVLFHIAIWYTNFILSCILIKYYKPP